MNPDPSPAIPIPSLQSDRRWTGRPLRRLEDPRFMTGEAEFVADVRLPDVAHAYFVRSPHAHALIRSYGAIGDIKRGVLAVILGDQLELPPLLEPASIDGLKLTPQPILAHERVRFIGEAVAVVVAESAHLAADVCDIVAQQVEYEPLPVAMDATLTGARLFSEHADNMVYRSKAEFGDVDSAFAKAVAVFKSSIRTNRQSAAPMECRGCIASYRKSSDELTVWSSTQNPFLLRSTLARALDLSHQRIRVIVPDIGGAFGQKAVVYPEEVAICWLARRLQRPVRWIETRSENLRAATHAKEQIVELEAAVDGGGMVLGLRARCISDAGAYCNSPAILTEPLLAATLMPGVYNISNYSYEATAVLTNKAPTGPYRAVGWTAGQTAREALLDQIARGLELDPAELRRRNLVRPDQLPYRSCTGMIYDSGSYMASLAKALDAIDYDCVREEQTQLRLQGRHVGVGLSLYVEPTAFGSEGAAQSGLPWPSNDTATVSVDPAGKVTVTISLPAQGQGHETSLAQVAADTLGAALEDIVVRHGETEMSTNPFGTGASRSAVIGAGTIARAARDVREQTLKVAAELLEVDSADLLLENSRVFVRGVPERGVSLRDVANAAYFHLGLRTRGFEPRLAATKFYDPPATYSNGCVAVVLEVDADTGEVRFQDVVAVADCGTVLNPQIVDGQIQGGVAQGIGAALYEEIRYSKDGQLLSGSLLDYAVPSIGEIPAIKVLRLVTPSPDTEGGVKGIGESGMLAAPAAVVNAVVDALCRFAPRIPRLPLTPERIVRMASAI